DSSRNVADSPSESAPCLYSIGAATFAQKLLPLPLETDFDLLSMAKNKKKGMVYSTSPDFDFSEESEEVETLLPAQQELRAQRDRKQRKGKAVTLITGFIGNETDLKSLGTTLNSKCGVGGSTKDGEIIIQGDFRDKVMEILSKEGYKAKKSGG